ncbi:MAG: MBL fold metallo-hydrolase [Chloroflexi bacterium]|nr:MAG: MBL fold metallo-hydrolase [Chloroflexota bacterium]
MKIQALDLHFQGIPETIASYLVIGSEGPVLVETGPGSTLTMLKTQLAQAGYHPTDIKHVLVTHIHLDHAGAAGWWAQNGAQIYVHEFGARHLIHPEKLWASASRIYGDKMQTLWGEMLPAPPERVTAVRDGDIIEIGDLRFEAIETPGHARHHHVFRLGNIAFTGDAAGIRLPGFNFLDIPAPPPEFDLETWLTTLDKLNQAQFSVIYPTHYGQVKNVSEHLAQIRARLQAVAEFVRVRMENGMSRDDLVVAYTEWNHELARAAGVSESGIVHFDTVNPLYMSVDGIMRYWRKRAEAAQSAT